jgi:hypothetical protein
MHLASESSGLRCPFLEAFEKTPSRLRQHSLVSNPENRLCHAYRKSFRSDTNYAALLHVWTLMLDVARWAQDLGSEFLLLFALATTRITDAVHQLNEG